jgi:hypothetical protein
VGQGSSTICPPPPHSEQGWLIEKKPWPCASTPRGAGLGAAAVAGGAAARLRDGDADLGALDRLVEAERDFGLEVAAADLLGLRPAAAAVEDPTEDVAEVEAAEASRAGAERRLSPLAEAGEDAALVVLLALLGIAEDVVGGGYLLELLLRRGVARVAVRVVLTDQTAVGLLDLVLGRLAIDPEDLVGVGGRHAATTTLAARRISSL